MRKITIYTKGKRTYFKQYCKFWFFWVIQFKYWSDENIDDIIDKHIASMQTTEPDIIIHDSRVKITKLQGTTASDEIIRIVKEHDRNNN